MHYTYDSITFNKSYFKMCKKYNIVNYPKKLNNIINVEDCISFSITNSN